MSRPKPEPDLDDEACAAFPDLDAPVKESKAAAFIGVEPGTLRQWRWQGKGPRFLKFGRKAQSKVSYEPRELIRYRNAMRRRSTSESAP